MRNPAWNIAITNMHNRTMHKEYDTFKLSHMSACQTSLMLHARSHHSPNFWSYNVGKIHDTYVNGQHLTLHLQWYKLNMHLARLHYYLPGFVMVRFIADKVNPVGTRVAHCALPLLSFVQTCSNLLMFRVRIQFTPHSRNVTLT